MLTPRAPVLPVLQGLVWLWLPLPPALPGLSCRVPCPPPHCCSPMPSLTSGASAALAQEQVTAPGFQQGPGLIGRERLLVLLDSWPCSMGGSSRRPQAPPIPSLTG